MMELNFLFSQNQSSFSLIKSGDNEGFVENNMFSFYGELSIAAVVLINEFICYLLLVYLKHICKYKIIIMFKKMF